MIATLPYLSERFQHFNRLCFDGQLPMPHIRLTTASSYIGQMRYHNRRRPDGTWERHDFTMNFSTRFDLPEADIEDTIIHEMIHYYIDFHNLEDSSIHGHLFRQMMYDINRRFQRHITISYRNSDILNTDTHQRPAVICVSRLLPHVPSFPAGARSSADSVVDSSPGITVCASSRTVHIARNLPRRYALLSADWYYTTDPYFNRFPRSREPLIYHVNSAELQQHLTTAIPLEFDGLQFRRKP